MGFTVTTIPWLLTFFAAGWLLGWFTTRDRRWAVLPGLGTTALMGTGLASRLQTVLPISSNLTRTAVAAGLGLLVLWSVSRLPSLPWRVGMGTLLVPVVATLCSWLALLLFFIIFQIP